MAIPVYLWLNSEDGKQVKGGADVNGRDRQHVKGMGPLPRGTYRIGGYTSSKGPMTITLTQISGESYGRSLFRIHGERKAPAPAGFASEGCIIMGPRVRGKIIHSTDNKLEVVR